MTITDMAVCFAGILAAAARAGSANCSLWTQQSPLKGKAAAQTAAGLCRSTPNAHALFPMLVLLAPTPEVTPSAVLPHIQLQASCLCLSNLPQYTAGPGSSACRQPFQRQLFLTATSAWFASFAFAEASDICVSCFALVLQDPTVLHGTSIPP